jgi:hypothetical protein
MPKDNISLKDLAGIIRFEMKRYDTSQRLLDNQVLFSEGKGLLYVAAGAFARAFRGAQHPPVTGDDAQAGIPRVEANQREVDKASSEQVCRPGRPSLKKLTMRRFIEMRNAGELEPNVSRTARNIVAWMAREYPDVPQPAAKTVVAHISVLFRQAQGPNSLKIK